MEDKERIKQIIKEQDEIADKYQGSGFFLMDFSDRERLNKLQEELEKLRGPLS